jgi:3-oxoacyl-[acyl-carrier protein] reductase
MIIVITGTSRGIGEALAGHYLSLEHEVIGCGRSALGMGDYTTVDISDEQAVDTFVSHIQQVYGYIDVLINNAGVGALNHFLMQPSWDFERIINVNLRGTMLMTQAFARLLRTAEHPRIVNFTSVAVPWRLAGESVYAATKAGVESLTRTLAHEFAPWRITVNAVGPTPTPTALLGQIPQSKLDALIERQAVKRMGTMEDIFNVVDWLIQPASDFVTGQVIYLGGVS